MANLRGTVLIIDDEEDILFSLKFALKRHFRSIITHREPAQLPDLIKEMSPDVILLDMNFAAGRDDGSEGLIWLQKIKGLDPDIPVIVMTAYSDVGIAVEALKAGAMDFVEKPWRNEKLLATINAAMGLSRTRQALSQLKLSHQALSDTIDQTYHEMIGRDEAMRDIFVTIDKVAHTDANVLVMGANGTGKELVARAIHRKSPRRQEVFMPVDLSSYDDDTFDTLMFGMGSTPLADTSHDRAGRFANAGEGTIFLDEVGNLSLRAQAELLQVLESGQLPPTEKGQPRKLLARVICASHLPLYEMCRAGKFREELLYLINTVEIRLPPLRERADDISPLADYFLRVYCRKYGKQHLQLTQEALERLEAYVWPGNVRELRHVIERAVILAEGQRLTAKDLTLSPPQAPGEGSSKSPQSLEEMERAMIRSALTRHDGNISRAAAELGITRASLYRRIEKYGL